MQTATSSYETRCSVSRRSAELISKTVLSLPIHFQRRYWSQPKMAAKSTGKPKREFWQFHDDSIFDVMCYLPRKDLTACEQASRKLHALAVRYRRSLAVPRMRVLPRVRIVLGLAALNAMILVLSWQCDLRHYSISSAFGRGSGDATVC